MTYSFGARSEKKLATCHPKIQELMRIAIKVTPYDFAVIEGHRSVERQQELFAAGMTQIDGITKLGKHNWTPSKAVDCVPFPIDWTNVKRFHILAGVILGVAGGMGLAIRAGIDWDGDGDFTDQSFHDLPHYELKE
jgi:hypothetical protein